MYKLTNLCQKKKSVGNDLPSKTIKVNDAVVRKIMGNHYSAYILSKSEIGNSIG